MDNSKIKNFRFVKFVFDFSSIDDKVQARGMLSTSALYPNDRKSFIVSFNYKLVDASNSEKYYLSFSANVFFEMINNALFNPELFDDEVVGVAFERLKKELVEIQKDFHLKELPLPSSLKAPVFKMGNK